jgi:hypothetical protein
MVMLQLIQYLISRYFVASINIFITNNKVPTDGNNPYPANKTPRYKFIPNKLIE